MTSARRLLPRIAVAGLALVAAGWIATQVSPWPMVWVIRLAFDAGARAASKDLDRHRPAGVEERRDLVYDPADPDGRLDVFRPSASGGAVPARTTVVWIHGGGFVSGTKDQIAEYARLIAARGFTVVTVDYTIAPRGTHPGPTRQANAAVAYLVANADALQVDTTRIVLAGDSAGSHIAAQLGIALTDPEYAGRLGITPALPPGRLAGLVLFCGVYDPAALGSGRGLIGRFVHTAQWAYSGTRRFAEDSVFALANLSRHLPEGFPPAFLSAGNADPLLPQSRGFAAALVARGAAVDTLFFPPDRVPPLGHEYQFSLSDPAGREALERVVALLAAR